MFATHDVLSSAGGPHLDEVQALAVHPRLTVNQPAMVPAAQGNPVTTHPHDQTQLDDHLPVLPPYQTEAFSLFTIM